MKVAILKSHLAQLGGLERYALYIAKGFHEKGCDTTILTTGPLLSDIAPIKQQIVSKKSSLSLYHLVTFDKACAKWLQENPHDIVFGLDRNLSQTHYRAGNGVHATYLKQRKFIESHLKYASFFFNPLHQFILRREKALFENPQLKIIFTNSNMVKSDIASRFNVAKDKLHTIYNGCDWHAFATPFSLWMKEKPHLIAKYHLNPNTFKLLFIGNGYKRKGLNYLLRALKNLSDANIELLIVGKDKEQRLFEELAKAYKIDHMTHFFGKQQNIIPFYQLADALAIPSLYDPFANVSLEAWAMGLFVLTSPYNGASEIITKENGCVIDNIFDDKIMADALLSAVRTPKTEQKSQCIRAQVAHLDLSLQLDKLLKLSLDHA